jgi:hypothetical protein
MPSITQHRLRQIIAEEVAAAMSDKDSSSVESMEQLPSISKAAIDLFKALNNFKEKCPPAGLSALSGLDQLESTLEDMAGNPGSYVSRGVKQAVRKDVQELQPPMTSDEEDEDDEEEEAEEEEESY